MIDSLVRWLGRYGYGGVALGVFLESAGVPIPGETVLLAAAFAAAHGVLALPVVIAVAAAAGVLGDNLGYALGRRWGRPWVERHGRWLLLSPSRLERADRFFGRFGPVAVALARFVTGIRVVAAVSAGVSRMPWPTFLRYNVLGAAAWAGAVGLVGYAFGKGWQGLARWAGAAGTALGLLVVVGLVAAWLFPRARRWWAEVEPDAWLRVLAWRETWVIGTSLAAVGLFAKVSEDVAEHESGAFDGAVRAWALAHRAPALDWAFGVSTRLGTVPVLVVVAFVLAWWLWRRGGPRVAGAVVAAPLGAAGLILGLKDLFERARPPGAARLGELNYGFPSGHTTAVTALGLSVAYVLLRERLAPRWIPVLAAITALTVGVSRVYLDAHWATDVIGGWAVGLFVATGSAGLYEWSRGRASGPKPAGDEGG
ncbi:MAG TPA: bifunctional DedA family/phosphatase PAP2 family protein [Gemmatimonadales bacterium]|nr:bifunctional DedA family/phosphatase PAP2 family protein [Gemmatimonadales bacterium]